MRCLSLKQGRFSWIIMNQIQNREIKWSLGNDVQNMTYVSSWRLQIAFIGKRTSVISYHLWKPFPRAWASYVAFFNKWITKGKPLELQVSSCWQGCLTSGSYTMFGKWIDPLKHSFIERCFFSLLTQKMCFFLQWRYVQASSSFPTTDNSVLKISLVARWLQCTCLPHYLQISRT